MEDICTRNYRFSFTSHRGTRRWQSLLMLVFFALSLVLTAVHTQSAQAAPAMQSGDLAVTKRSNAGGAVDPGDTILYTITVRNNGTAPHNHVLVTDPLPAGTTYVPQSTRITYPASSTSWTYLDQFNTIAYTNSNGSAAWPGSWVEGGADSAGDPAAGTTLIFGGRLRFNGSTLPSTLTRSIPMTDVMSAVLSFEYYGNGITEAGDELKIEIFDGTSWQLLQTLTGPFAASGTVNQVITTYAGVSSQIRFTATGFMEGNGQDKERVELDNVQIQFVAPGSLITRDNIPQGTYQDLYDGAPSNLVVATDAITLPVGYTLTINYEVVVNNPRTPGVRQITNTVSVDSDELTTPVTASVSDTLRFAAMSLTKTASRATATIDDVITYTFTATNTGTVPLTSIVVSDPMFSPATISGCTVALLAPLASTSCSADHVVTLADVAGRPLVNTATAQGRDPQSVLVSASAAAAVTTVNPARPTADPEFATAVFNRPASLGNVTEGDVAHGTGNQIVTGTIDLDPTLTGNQATFTAEGHTWSADPLTGVVTFTPAENFVDLVSISYSVEDRLGQEASASLDVMVDYPPPPYAGADYADTGFNTPVTFAVTSNDYANGDRNSIVAGTIDLDIGLPGNQASVTVLEGTWTANHTTGEVTFTPAENYYGTVLKWYTVEDEIGQETFQAFLTVDVAQPNNPTAYDDAATTTFNDPVTFTDILANDDPDGTGNSMLLATIDLDPGTGGYQTTYTALGHTWVADTTTGEVTFTPAENFTGPASIQYAAADEVGQTDTAGLSVNVLVPDAPTVGSDTTTTAFNTPVDLPNITANDTAAGTRNSILAATIDLDPTADGQQLTRTVDSHTWTVSTTTGIVTFTPAENFTGPASITYRVADEISQGGSADLTVTVLMPAAPTAADNSQTTAINTPAVFADITANETAYGTGNSIVLTTLDLDPETGGYQTSFTDSLNNLWTADTATGEVTFTPAENFTGPASIPYTVEDEIGQEADAQLNVIVTVPGAPALQDDSASTSFNEPVTLTNITANDTAYGYGNSLVLTTLDLDPLTAGYQTSFTDSLTNTWSVDTATGAVTFTPAENFTGPASIQYTVEDELQRIGAANLSVTVNMPAAPAALDDSADAVFNTLVDFPNITANDTAYGTRNSILAATIDLDPAADGQQTTLPIDGHTWTVSTTTGIVTFTPAENFTGPASITYRVADEVGQTDTASLSVTVLTPAAPTAADDAGGTPVNIPVTLPNITTNDTAPGLRNSFVLTTIDLDPGTPGVQTSYPDAGHTWEVNPASGEVTFTPTLNYIGTRTITYSVQDELGRTASASLSVTVMLPVAPTAADDAAATTLDSPAAFTNITANDTANGQGNSLVIATIDLNPDLVDNQATLTKDGHTWTANTQTGAVTFTPASGFSGTVSIPYSVEDLLGQEATANLSVTVDASFVLVSFDADPVSEKVVNLHWSTANENGAATYRLLRASVNNLAQATQVTTLTANPVTMTYDFTDSTVPQDGQYWYWLVKVFVSGSGVTSSPISVTTTPDNFPIFLPMLSRRP